MVLIDLYLSIKFHSNVITHKHILWTNGFINLTHQAVDPQYASSKFIPRAQSCLLFSEAKKVLHPIKYIN